MKSFDPRTVCRNCPYKQVAGSLTCPFDQKYMCPDYQAYMATNALEYKDSALQIPLESLLTALRFHGYSGELRKSSTVII